MTSSPTLPAKPNPDQSQSGTAFDQILQGLARLAARALSVPLVMVCCWQSGRLRVQAADGEDVVSLEACEVFATAFRKVAHSTNQESGPLFLGALDQDPHFAQSDLVQGRTGMRFVAAMPLLSADETSAGDRFLGDVLVLDRQSRDLAAGELQALGDIAALAVDHLVRVSEQAQEARRIETQLRTTISTMTDALFVLDADQRFALFNDHYLDLLALPPALVHVGAPVEPVIRFHAERGDYGPGPVEELIQIRVDRLSAPVSVQTQLFIDGGKRILDLRKAPMEGGGAVVVATDVTERTKAEALLADQKAIIETVLENIDQGVLMVDAADGIKATNSRYAEMLDLPADWRDHFDSYGEIARYYYEKVHGLANSPEALEAALQTVRSRERLVTEVEIQDGRFVEVRQNPLSDGGIVRTYLDVTERKRVEQQIAQKEQHWRSLLETSNEGIWFIDNDALTTDINRSLSGILQREKQDVVGCYLYEFLDAKSQEVFFDQLEQRRKGNASSYEVVIERPDGSTIPVLINGTPMFDAWGRKIGSFGMVTDLTEVKKNERRLTDAYGVISDSINYASNIQRALLGWGQLLGAIMEEHFVIWEPRDVVSGDLYWSHMWGDGILVIVADCTGHGVPGAFMTLLTTGAIDRAMAEVRPRDVAGLIQRVHQIIQITLGQHGGRGTSNDGMDLGVCFIEPDMTELRFAGGRFSLFKVQDGAVEEIISTRKGVGYRGIPTDQTYQEVRIPVSGGTSFYLCTDGFPDQVGGPRNRMLGKRQLKSLLLQAQDMAFAQQKQFLLDALRDFQGTQERRDDVTMIGFRILTDTSAGQDFSI